MPKSSAVFLIFFVVSTWSLPEYGFRSTRACDNCHGWALETEELLAWPNPALAERKCNMSCQSCHINPAGGGLRNGGGRYYQASTLPMFKSRGRPYQAQKKEIVWGAGISGMLTESDFSPERIKRAIAVNGYYNLWGLLNSLVFGLLFFLLPNMLLQLVIDRGKGKGYLRDGTFRQVRYFSMEYGCA